MTISLFFVASITGYLAFWHELTSRSSAFDWAFLAAVICFLVAFVSEVGRRLKANAREWDVNLPRRGKTHSHARAHL